jgi:hypothetical protein
MTDDLALFTAPRPPLPESSNDLVAAVLAEGAPGQFRQALADLGPSPTDRDVFDRLVAHGWVEGDEAGLAQWPIQAALTAGQPEAHLAVVLALLLLRVNVRLDARGAFDDDTALAAAVDVAQARL